MDTTDSVTLWSRAMSKRQVVIVGGGFGGLTAARALRSADVEVTLIDKNNHHLFQPLLYQVAIAGLSPSDIAYPIRAAVSNQRNVRVLLGEVTAVDLEQKSLVVAGNADHPSLLPPEGATDGAERVETVTYDYLILAAGVSTSYFGHPEWEEFATGLKSLADAIEIRRRVLLAFEAAERVDDEKERARLLTFVVIGGGPTGVELAGATAELARRVIAQDFRSIRPELARVLLIEGGARLLPAFDPTLSASAAEQLKELGVEMKLGSRVEAIDATGVVASGERIPTATVMWAAGVAGNPLAKLLGTKLDHAGRIEVGPDCTLQGRVDVFAIGDMAVIQNEGKPLTGLSPIAMQQARYVAKIIRDELPQKDRKPFHYVDKGIMATIGRSRAIAEAGKIKMRGFVAWLAWLFVHIWFLIGFRNRVVVLINWAWAYVFYHRGARLITGRAKPLQEVAVPTKPSEVNAT